MQDLAFKTLQDIYFPSETAYGSGERDNVGKEFKLKLERKMILLSGAVLGNRRVTTLFYEFLEKASEKGTKYDFHVDQMVRTLMSQVPALDRGDGGDSSSDLVCFSLSLSFFLGAGSWGEFLFLYSLTLLSFLDGD